MNFSSLQLLPDFENPKHSEQIAFLHLRRFEQDLLDSGIDFAYTDDTMLEGGLIAGGSPALHKEYALEVYRLCTDGLSLPHQKKYDELLEIIQASRASRTYRREYHFNGNEEGIKKEKWFIAIAEFLLDFSFYVTHNVVDRKCFSQPVRYIDKDYFVLDIQAFFNFETREFLVEEELLFYILVKIDELMEDCDFYLK